MASMCRANTRFVAPLMLGIGLFWLPGCAGGQGPKVGCAQSAPRGQPTFCAPDEATGQFVVGLPAGHGWDRGDWVLLDRTVDGFVEPIPVAMAVVTQSFDTMAQVRVLYQTTTGSLRDAHARRVSKDGRVRLGKFVGRVVDVGSARMRIDIGRTDKVVVGDIYEVLSERDHAPITRVKITEVGEAHAFAVPIGVSAREELRVGQDAVFSKDASSSSSETPLLILVVNFDPHDTKSAEEAKAGRGFAKDLADALAKGTDGTSIKVRYEDNERVRLGSGDKEAHDAARLVGKRFQADLVVWGSMRCNKQACALPRFTVVEPNLMMQPGSLGNSIFMDRDTAGFAFKGDAPKEPIGIATTVLGVLAANAQRHADAAYYLRLAVASKALSGEDELFTLIRLASCEDSLQQSALAFEHASSAMEKAKASGNLLMEQFARVILAGILSGDRRHDEADKLLEAVFSDLKRTPSSPVLLYAAAIQRSIWAANTGHLDWARDWATMVLTNAQKRRDPQPEAAAEQLLGSADFQENRLDDADRHYQRALQLWRGAPNTSVGEAWTLQMIGQLEMGRKNLDAARSAFDRAIELFHRTNSALGEAMALAGRAAVAVEQLHIDEAQPFLERLVQLNARITVPNAFIIMTYVSLAGMTMLTGKLQQAEQALTAGLDMAKRTLDPKTMAQVLHMLGMLRARQFNLPEAEKSLVESLRISRQLKDRKQQASTLTTLGEVTKQQGRASEARALFEEALQILSALGDQAAENQTRVSLAALDGAMGKREEALRAFGDLLVRARESRNKPLESNCEMQISAVYAAMGRYREASAHAAAAGKILDDLGLRSAADEARAVSESFKKVRLAWESHADLLADGAILVGKVDRGSNAEKAGMESGDLLIQYGKTRLVNLDALKTSDTLPSQRIKIELLRGKDRMTLDASGGPLGIDSLVLPPRPAKSGE